MQNPTTTSTGGATEACCSPTQRLSGQQTEWLAKADDEEYDADDEEYWLKFGSVRECGWRGVWVGLDIQYNTPYIRNFWKKRKKKSKYEDGFFMLERRSIQVRLFSISGT